MEDKVFQSERVWNWQFIMGSLFDLLNLVLFIVIIYFIVKLYRKVIKFLDKNS